MIDFSITDNQTKQSISYSLPTSWDDVTWKQYEDYTLLNELDWDDSYAKTEAQLSVLASIPTEKIKEIGFQMVVELIKYLDFLKQAPVAYPKAHVEIGGEVYYAQKLESFGEIIAHNKVSSRDDMTFNQKLPYLLAISLRKKVTKAEERVSTKWYKKPFGIKETSIVETQEVEPFNNNADWVENRATLFSNALTVSQIQSFAAFFLSNTEAMQSAFQSYLNLQPLVLRQATSLERTLTSIMVGNWQSGIFARIQLMSISFYFYLLTKYFTVLNTNN
jgi:hypothetical protein